MEKYSLGNNHRRQSWLYCLQFFLAFVRITLSMSESQSGEGSLLLQDSEYDIIHQIEKKSDFVHSAAERYVVREAEKDNRSEPARLGHSIKQDEQEHLQMLKEDKLILELADDKFG